MTRQLVSDDGYLAVSVDVGKAGAKAAYRARYGRDPVEVLFAGTAWLAGPIPQAAPLLGDPGRDDGARDDGARYEQGGLF